MTNESASELAANRSFTHMIHMLICVCTMGFVFPNAFVENMARVAYVENDDVGKK